MTGNTNKYIIITEKPSMGANIAKGLDCNKKGRGYTYSDNIYITWAVGHLFGLKTPKELDEKYEKWSLDDLPIFYDLHDKYKLMGKTASQYKVILSLVKRLISRGEHFNLIHAGDPDREGELIVRLIKKALVEDLKKEGIILQDYIDGEYRMWINDFSKENIKKEFNKKRDISEYDNYFQSALARQHSDWLIGMNLTVYYTLLSGGDTMNTGRVKSTILRIFIDKELEIINYKEEFTYKIIGELKGNTENLLFSAEWFSDKLKNGKLISKNQASIVSEALKEIKEFEVISKNFKEKKESLTGLYTLDDLPVDAENKFGYNPKDTLEIMQSLYETHKIISYPRVKSSFITEDEFGKVLKSLTSLKTTDEYKEKFETFDSKHKIEPNKNFVDTSKVGAHSGIFILPPDSGSTAEKYKLLSTKEKNIFDLVVSRILAVMAGEYIYESSELVLQNGLHFFKTKGKIVTNLGYKEFYGNSKGKDIEIPILEKGDKVILEKTEIKEIKNKKPGRYTRSGLAKSIGDLALLLKDNKELSKRIKEISPEGDEKIGLGTGPTRISIIEELISKGFLEVVGKTLKPTNKGFKITSIIKEIFKDPVTTGEWEDYIKKIEEGKETYDNFINKLKKEIEIVINEKNPIGDFDKYPFIPNKERDGIIVCPKCKIGDIREWDKGYSCSNRYKCGLIIWKDFLGNAVSKENVKTLLTGGKVENMKIHSKKTNKDYKASLYYDFKKNKLELKF